MKELGTQFNLVFLLFAWTSFVQVYADDGTVVSDTCKLPKTIFPKNYEIDIILKHSSLSDTSNEFEGSVKIELEAAEKASEIKLHAAHDYLKLNEISVGETVIARTNYSVDPKTDILTIKLSDELNENESTSLTIRYTGVFGKNLQGLCKIGYIASNAEKKYIVATMFEPSYARRAFPCFDEPTFKADFQINVTYPEGYNVISNVAGEVQKNDTVEKVKLAKSSGMSPYLVGFVASNFTCSQSSIEDIRHRVCSREETANMREWALEMAPKLLVSIKKYTQHDYYLRKSKLDQVALPEYALPSMEYWGLVMYREEQLLWHNDDNMETKKEVTLSMAYQLTQFWFRDMEVQELWADLLIRNGITTYLAYACTADSIPDWQMDKQFVVDVVQRALLIDSQRTDYPSYSDITDPNEIDMTFDEFIGLKGAALFHMLKNVMGTNNFQKGLSNFLSQSKAGAASVKNLWKALEAAIDNSTTKLPASLEHIMYNWTHYPGFPLVTATVKGSLVEITQERFMESGDDDIEWYIPICFSTYTGEMRTCDGPDVWLTPNNNNTVTYDLKVTKPQWVLINNHMGYFRVNYDHETWYKIKAALASGSGIDEMNRAQIYDDIFNLASIGKISYLNVLDYLHPLDTEESYFTWVSITMAYDRLVKRIGSNNFRLSQNLMGLSNILYSGVFLNLRVVDESDHISSLQQGLIFKSSCALQSIGCIILVQSHFLKFVDDGLSAIPKNIRSTVFCYGITILSDDSEVVWEAILDLYQKQSLTISERKVILKSLSCTPNTELQKRYVKMTVSREVDIKMHHKPMMFDAICYNGFDVALNFLKENPKGIEELYPVNIYPSLLMSLAEAVNNQNRSEKLKAYIESGKVPAKYSEASAEALRLAEYNADWSPKYEKDLEKYFTSSEKRRMKSGALSLTVKCLHVYYFLIPVFIKLC